MSTAPRVPISEVTSADTRFGTLLSAEQLRKLERLPPPSSGEMLALEGGAIPDTRYTLGRSPGCFAARIVEGGNALVVGEDWIGPGTNTSNGGLKGCATSSPGICYSGQGLHITWGGSTRISASTLYSQAGEYGTTLLLAIIKPPYTGVSFYAIPYDSWARPLLGGSGNFHLYLSKTYKDSQIFPICLFLLSDVSGPKITDIFWSLESPSISFTPSLYYLPWAMSVYGSSSHYFSVNGGYFCDGWSWWWVNGIEDIPLTDPTYVWLSITYSNSRTTPPEASIEHGNTTFPYCTYSWDIIPSYPDPTTIPVSGYFTANIPLAYWSSSTPVVYQYCNDYIFLPRGITYAITRCVGYRWVGNSFQLILSSEYYINGVLSGIPYILPQTIFTTGPCP